METVSVFLESCRLGKKQVHRNLTVFPLLGTEIFDPEYLLLEQALAEDLVEIRELGRDGSVPELRLVSRGALPVLIVEGEELSGAKQNRVLNASIFVAAKTELVIPVSCVEQGRWHYRSDKFSSGEKMMHASLRRAAQDSVSFSLRHGDGYRSDQGRVWEEVACMADRLDVDSPTMAASEVFARYADHLNAYLQGFTLMQRQVGAVFAIDGQVVGLEAFGSGETFGRFFAKLVKSYALDAIDSEKKDEAPATPAKKVRRFLASAAGARTEPYPAVGLGETRTLSSGVVSGTALVYEERVLHLSAFRRRGRKDDHRVGFPPFSRSWQRILT